MTARIPSPKMPTIPSPKVAVRLHSDKNTDPKSENDRSSPVIKTHDPAVEDHFSKALGDVWTKISAK